MVSTDDSHLFHLGARTESLSRADSLGVPSDCRGQQPQPVPAARATAFRSPKAVKAAGRPAVYRRQLPGRGLRERGTLGERPGGGALPAPPAGEEPWCRRARTGVRGPETHSRGSPSARDVRSLQNSVRLCKVLCVNIPSRRGKLSLIQFVLIPWDAYF